MKRPTLTCNWHKTAPTAETETRRPLDALAKAKAKKREEVEAE